MIGTCEGQEFPQRQLLPVLFQDPPQAPRSLCPETGVLLPIRQPQDRGGGRGEWAQLQGGRGTQRSLDSKQSLHASPEALKQRGSLTTGFFMLFQMSL